MKQIKVILFIIAAAFVLSCEGIYNEAYDEMDSVIYNLRDRGPAGGWIFYINPNADNDGWKYLEVAPVNTEWTNIGWGTSGFDLEGTKIEIGTGRSNTALIIEELNKPTTETGKAAQLCDSLNYGGYNDWFLPSRDELGKVRVNLYSGTDENGVVLSPRN